MAELQKNGGIKAETKTDINPAALPPEYGVFLRGVVLGARARLFKGEKGKKDSVQITYEFSFDPGVANVEQYLDVDTAGLEIKDGQVLKFPHLPKYSEHYIKVNPDAKVFGNKTTFKNPVFLPLAK